MHHSAQRVKQWRQYRVLSCSSVANGSARYRWSASVSSIYVNWRLWNELGAGVPITYCSSKNEYLYTSKRWLEWCRRVEPVRKVGPLSTYITQCHTMPNTLSPKLYTRIGAAIISVYVCLFQCAKKAVIPAMMQLAALSARAHIDQYQGMQTHLTTVRVSHVSCDNCYALSTRFYTVTRISWQPRLIDWYRGSACRANAKQILEPFILLFQLNNL